MNSSNDFFGSVIYSYTRNQAIEDGELVDVSSTAKEAGFKLSVAVTRSVWCQYIEWTPADDDKQTVQHESGRLWDILWKLSLACRCCANDSTLNYHLYVIPRDGHSRKPRQIELKAVIGGGDNGEAVITVMLPDED
jgi:hypothetical protein